MKTPFVAATEHDGLFRQAASITDFEEVAWHALFTGAAHPPVGVPYEAYVIPVIISPPVQDKVIV